MSVSPEVMLLTSIVLFAASCVLVFIAGLPSRSTRLPEDIQMDIEIERLRREREGYRRSGDDITERQARDGAGQSREVLTQK